MRTLKPYARITRRTKIIASVEELVHISWTSALIGGVVAYLIAKLVGGL